MKNADSREKAFEIEMETSPSAAWGEDRAIPMTNDILKYLFTTEDWVYIAIDLLATEATSAKFRVMQWVPGPEGKRLLSPAEDHPMNAVLTNPYSKLNVGQSSFSYLQGVEYFLGGNFLAWKHRGKDKKIQLLPLQFDKIQVNVGKLGELESYTVTVSDDTESPSPKKLILPAKDVLHIRKPNPHSLFWGMSPLLAGKRSIAFNKLTQEYLNNFYFKGAAPQMVLETEGNVNADQLSRMVKSFEQSYTGRKNLRRTLALPKGVTAKTFPASIADQRLVELIKINREVILNLLHVPKHAMSLQEAGSLGSNEYKTALQYLWSSTLTPSLNLWAETYTLFFAEELGEGYVIMPDFSNVSVLKEDLLAKAQLAKEMLQTLTLNEVRQAVWSREPIQGGDVVTSIAPVPGIPDEMQPQMPSKPSTTGEEAPPPAQPEPSTETPEAATPKLFPTIDVDGYLGERKSVLSERNKATEGTVSENMAEMTSVSGNILLKMAEISAKEILRYKHIKADINTENLEERLRRAFEDIQDEYMKDTGAALTAAMESGTQSGVSLVFGAPDTQAIEAVVARDSNKRRVSLEARQLEAFAEVSKTTTEQIMARVEEGIKANKTVTEIAGDVLGYFEETAWARAEKIARTETLTAVSIGQAASMKAAQSVIPGLKKIWVSSGDDRVRGKPGGKYENSKNSHDGLHGQVQDASDPFVDPKSGGKLQYPRDVKADPSERIGCRCTWVMADPKDLETILTSVGGR